MKSPAYAGLFSFDRCSIVSIKILLVVKTYVFKLSVLEMFM